MTIMELAAIPLWTLGVAGATTGALALVLCAFADDSLFIPDLSRRKILIWGLVLVTGSAPCLLSFLSSWRRSMSHIPARSRAVAQCAPSRVTAEVE